MSIRSLTNLKSARMRISGLNSGLDTESIISGLMQAERMKVSKVYRNKIRSEWKLEAYTKINNDLMNFSNKYFSALSSDSIMSASAYTTYSANYKENSAFKVTGSAGVIPGNYNITNVRMADYAKISGTTGASRMTEASGSALSKYLTSEVSSSELKVADGSVAAGNTKLSDIVDANGKSAFGFTDSTNKVKFTINGKSVVLNATDTVDQAISKINKSGAKVNASFDSATGKITFAGKEINLSNVEGKAIGEKGAFGIKEGAQPRSLSFDTASSLRDIAAAGGPDFMDGASELKFSINGQEFTFDENDSLDDIINTVNNSGAGVKMSIDKSTGEFFVRSTATNSELTIQNTSGALFSKEVTGVESQKVTKPTTVTSSDSLANVARKMGIDLQLDSEGKFSFSVNGKEFSFDASQSVGNVMAEVNSSGAGVKMYYSELTDSFSFTSTTLGSDSKIQLGNTGGSNAFGDGGIFGIATSNMSAAGVDASITINGETVTRSTNTFAIDGMRFDITGNYTATGTDTGYNVSFTHDTDSTINKVKAFIEDYNKLVEDLSSMLKEKKFYDYYPLTDEEIEALDNEKDVEKWTEKAKSGIMRSDTVVSSLLSNLRGAAYAIVGDTGKMAAEIGITTNGKNGTLKLDEDVFRKALAEDPNKVAKIMTGTSSAKDADQKYAESGFAVRVFQTMSDYRTSVRANQMQEQTKKIYDFETRIKDIEKKLEVKEQPLWRKYANLEKLMGSLNSQSDWIASQLSVLG